MAVAFDVLIRGGTLADGTGGPLRKADLGLADGRIRAIGRLDGASAPDDIDARGRVVTPGFIDLHTHSDVTLLDDPLGESMVVQGVTTNVVGNCSHSTFPARPASLDALRATFGQDIRSSRPWDWVDLEGWAACHEAAGIGINVAPLVGHAALRIAVGAVDERIPTPAQLAEMQRLAVEAIEQGAFGVSTGLTVPPSSYARTAEIVALARSIAPFTDTLYATHARIWGGRHVASVEEAVAIGRKAGIPVQYSHIAIIDRRAFGEADRMLGVIDRARADGLDVTYDVYPYTAAGTGLVQLVPEWAQAGGVAAMLERLSIPDQRARIRADVSKGWFRGIPWDWDSLVLSDIGSARNRPLLGRSLHDVARERDRDPIDTFLDLIAEERNEVAVVAHNRWEPDVRAFLVHAAGMVGSDGAAISPTGLHGPPQRPHPRYYGTFPRVLGGYVRETPLLTLEEAVRKMTGAPAARLGLRDRGIIAEGLAADLVVFDPATIIDRATFDAPHQYPDGIDAVFVNGVTVVRHGRTVGARPGRVLRRRTAPHN